MLCSPRLLLLIVSLAPALGAAQTATPPATPVADPVAPRAQIAPGHLGVSFGIPGLAPPLLPLSLPEGFEGLRDTVPLRGAVPLGLRVRATDALALRFALGALRQSEGLEDPQLTLRLEGGGEWHLLTEGPFSPYLGGLAAATVFGAAGAQSTTFEIGGILGLEYFFTPRIAAEIELRALVQTPQGDATGAAGLTSGGATVNLYF